MDRDEYIELGYRRALRDVEDALMDKACTDCVDIDTATSILWRLAEKAREKAKL